MATTKIKILHIEDDISDAIIVDKKLNNGRADVKVYKISHRLNLNDATKALREHSDFDVILLDMNLPDGNRIQNIAVLREISPHTPIIIVTSEQDEGIAAKALQSGAQECIAKCSLSNAVLSRVIQSSILRNQKQIELSHKAYFDDLTGLPNRQSFENSAQALITNSLRWKKRDALMFIDLNKFKFINDTYGHQAGNTVLKQLSDRLKNVLRDSDLIARYAGDEFVIYLNSGNTPITEDLCINIAKKIITLVERPIDIGDREIEISLSIGIAIFPDAGNTFEQLLKNADLAMYEAKKSNHTHYKIISNVNKECIEALPSTITIPSSTRKNILIIEDDKHDLELYKIYLKNYKIVEATNSHDAFQILETLVPACIILDYNLPDTTGLSFFNKFKSSKHYNKIPIILVTGKQDSYTAVKAMKQGAKDYIVKEELAKTPLEPTVKKVILEQASHDEANLRQLELEKQNKELYDFSNTVAHDLKSPARKISTFCDLVLEEDSIKDNKKIYSYIERISVNAHRMNSLIKSLLDYAHIKHTLKERQIISLKDLTQDVITELSHWLHNENVVVHVSAMPSWPVHQSTIRQLLVNLITNGVKYKQAGKQTLIEINAEIKDDNCIISVKDNGQGIEPKQISNIFKPFYRLHSQDAIEGTGLGLSICSKIAKEHNGQIYAESIKGKGSTFITSLPRY